MFGFQWECVIWGGHDWAYRSSYRVCRECQKLERLR